MTTLSTSEIAMKRRVSLMLEINVNENRRDNQRMDNQRRDNQRMDNQRMDNSDTQYNTEN
jgi:hypothetical protein